MSHVGPDAEHWFSLSRELLCTLDREGRVLAANDAWGEVLGYAREALEGMTLASIMHPKDAGRLADVVAGLGEPGAVGDVRVRCASRGGEWRLVSWRARAHGDRVYVVGRDETALLTVEAERDALSARMRGSAQHDQLTGLLTREAWHTWLKHELMRAGRSGMPLGVVLIDIDGFRAMNEARGRGEADDLLRDCARAWRQAIRATDCLGRLGGDDFALLLPDCDVVGAHEVLDRLREETPAGVTTSMGVAEWRPPEPPERLLLRADRALYAAKRQGRDRVASVR
jgi:diguanylate cyclase (GGDEF)-like protein/PAS domain S-box-containing protein